MKRLRYATLRRSSPTDSTTYRELPHYYGQNLLAKSLNGQCYERNPGFFAYQERSGLPFQPHQDFKRADLDARQKLYQQIAEEIWHQNRLTKAVESERGEEIAV